MFQSTYQVKIMAHRYIMGLFKSFKLRIIAGVLAVAPAKYVWWHPVLYVASISTTSIGASGMTMSWWV